MMIKLWQYSLLCLVLFSFPAQALSPAVSPEVSAPAAIASAHPLATEAGIEILQKGGNAFDAAIAVTSTLAVVEPYGSGIGGGGFWLLHEAKNNRDIMLDGRERAPLAASRNMYLDEAGNVIPGASVNGPLAAGIPGVPAALEHLAVNYGRLPLSESLKPAIRYARNGFTIASVYTRMAGFRLDALNASKDAASIFLRDGRAPDPGTRIVQDELANTLTAIARDGARAFYRGDIAEKLVSSVKRHGGIWSLEDLSSYKVIERVPDVAYYKEMKLVTAASPSSGGMALSQMLNMLSHIDIESYQGAARIHRLAEVMRRAYRDRAEYLGDPDFVDVPVEKLASNAYAMQLVKTITEQATPSESLGKLAQPAGQGSDTSHFSVVDAEGNRVAATLSINYPFGSGFVAEDTGVLLNDEMDDFSAKPGEPNVYGLVGAEANAIEPGKRMLSSMSPSFIEMGDRIAVIGTPGGSRIITMVLLASLDFFEGKNAEQIVSAGRFHHQYLPDKLFFEADVLDSATQSLLQKKGHHVQLLDNDYGNMQVVIVNTADHSVEAASDPRGIGYSQVIRVRENSEIE